ncbi:unnamed protein product [Schistosoma margrebowiei]|uniref:Uncharacterized protein n=1 Tax=Schistosoma margrebowiei TaxID=48269 RepID=A0AA84ZRN2_9TREM|nr:unnamed protein product [Schistosoma margrebowiei]
MTDKTSDTMNVSHLPAVKAGKMRIVKHVKTHDAPADVRCEEESPHELLTKEEIECHDRCIKAYHDKPMPTVTKPHNDNTKRIIQQPLK